MAGRQEETSSSDDDSALPFQGKDSPKAAHHRKRQMELEEIHDRLHIARSGSLQFMDVKSAQGCILRRQGRHQWMEVAMLPSERRKQGCLSAALAVACVLQKNSIFGALRLERQLSQLAVNALLVECDIAANEVMFDVGSVLIQKSMQNRPRLIRGSCKSIFQTPRLR